MDNHDPLVSKLSIDILVENSCFKGNLLAEHGLSILINAETEDDKRFQLLFDTGSSGSTLKHNLIKLEKKITELNGIILSHGHYDHSGGLGAVFDLLEKKIPIYLHPDALNPKFSKNSKKLRDIGVPNQVLSRIKKDADLKISPSPQFIHPSIFTTGQIDRTTSFEKVHQRFCQKINGDLIHDDILDDQALIIKLKTGIVLICGCGHSGIVNIIRYAIKLSKIDRFNIILGGLHLINANLDVISATMNELKHFNIDLIGPNHCTGLYPTTLLVSEYLDRFREMHVGDSLILG